jgi:hypothetical protein
MTTHGQWITKSTGIGASLSGVAGFFYGAYIIATNLTLGWTDVLDTVGSAAVVLLFAVMIGSLCIVIGGLAGLVLGIGTFPLSSLSEKRWVREVCGGELRKQLDELSGRTPPRSFNPGDHEQGVRVFDSKLGEVVASPPVSLAQQEKKIA